jgi:hypothetical protein
MPENDHINGRLDEIELGFVEREAPLELLMKLGIQLHLTGQSLSNTVSILEIFGVERRDRPSTTGFTRQSYSPTLVGSRTTSRLTRR